MLAKATYSPKWTFFICRIYRFLLAVVLVFASYTKLFPQEVGSYKTIQSGDYSNLSTWNIFDGVSWSAPSVKPNSTHDIYIDQSHTLRLVGNESAKNVFINAELGAGVKLNLNGNRLEVYGSLNSFTGAAPGIPSGTWNSQNWIGNSITSKIVFKGSSRTILPKGAWSGFTINSRYSVEFDPGPGVILRIEEPFKALEFVIKSGTVIQTLDDSVLPNTCSTFSFNNEAVYGSGAFGNFFIESGGRLTSECNNDILFRSSSQSASSFNLNEGAELILEGTSPLIEASTFQMNGKVIFRNNSNPQNFLSSSYFGSGSPISFHDIEIEGSQNLLMPPNLTLTGNMEQKGSGSFQLSSTELEFAGADEQSISGFSMQIGDLNLNKTAGTVSFQGNLVVLNNLKMNSGTLNLLGNNFSINTSLTGELEYSGGSWININQFTYFGVPSTFDATNATFPFEDKYQGGIRKVQLLGSSSGGNLQISFTEYKGVDYSASFSDSDGTPILYRLFSYFQFDGLNPSSNPLELRISADQLIVDQVDDLRIVSTGYAAPGNHLPGLDPGLWARRNLTFDDLKGLNFTIGSYRTLTILPLFWIKTSAAIVSGLPKIEWEIANHSENSFLEVFRFTKMNSKKKIVRIENPHLLTENEFIDSLPLPLGEIYYQLKYVNSSGEENWSAAFRLTRFENQEIKLFPNPSINSENVYLILPTTEINSIIQIIGPSGNLLHQGIYVENDISSMVRPLPIGYYIIRVIGKNQVYTFRLVKN
ncbi:T9SS type A sorting domain-containing protein [Algoriphagus sp.]|uniref:T9SS type A sorting domain-containing protein n=1 Tax=Algoriphagus sp. TaxID=1872435 RepID=UPI0025F5E00D|nr:T9SS type A sorting domain-containing protein [Algoriphagus sp.]